MNAALLYHADAFDTSRPRLMGRHAAGEGFLKGYARHGEADPLYCFTKTDREFADFKARVAQLAGHERPCTWIPHNRRENLAEPGCLFIPAPTLAEYAWHRRFGAADAYSLCGVTHTTASHNVMGAIGDLMLAPFQPWDAIICTSQSVRATVGHLLENWGAYLDARVGGKAHCPVQLPVIPLGIDCDAFAPSPAHEKARRDLRKRFAVAKNDIVVLYMGRISYHAKAHPMPLYLALEETAKRTGKRIHLIQAGWFGSETIRENFVDGAKAFCPSVRTLFLDGRQPDIRETIWFASDIFVSLSDNIQETFGLTPVEAMAAGLPVVVSDWDGYRETVRHGIDGIAIPTAMPAAGIGEGFAYRHLLDLDNYDRYIGHASQCVAVDVPACTEAFHSLVTDGNLRRRMGEAGRKRAREVFDWRVVVAAYQELWADLAARRKAEDTVAARAPGAPAHPLRDDPFAIYADYPTTVIGPDTRVTPAPGADRAALAHVRSLVMNDFAAPFLMTAEDIEVLLGRLVESGPVTVAELLAETAPGHKINLQRSLAWLAKMGLVSIAVS